MGRAPQATDEEAVAAVERLGALAQRVLAKLKFVFFEVTRAPHASLVGCAEAAWLC